MDLITSEIPGYERLQDAVAQATAEIDAQAILDLGAGTGVTARRVASLHPDATLVGVDASGAMLELGGRAVAAGHGAPRSRHSRPSRARTHPD
jgi:tRNA (cmo5U34)-methyltransferase